MPGLHLIADLARCPDQPLLRQAPALQQLCRREAAAAGLQVVGELFHPFLAPDGAPLGVTGVLLLAESHVALHTWPERGVVTLDVYVCNVGADHSAGAEALLAALIEALQPGQRTVQRVQRG